MSEKRAAGAVPLLAILVAVLLPAAVLAATAVDQPGNRAFAGGETAGEAELSRSGLPVGEAVGLSEAPTATVPATTSSTSRTAPTTTPPTTRATTGSTQATLPPGVPPPPVNTTPTGIPNIPPASEWWGERDGVSARLRMDPATPAPGQTVRFTLDYASAEPCCTVMLDFGDGGGFAVNNGATCTAAAKPGSYQAVTTHAFAAGAHKLTLSVITGDACSTGGTIPPGGAPPIPVFHSVTVYGCVGVGAAGQAGCSPFPTFGPDTIISPVLDPFCQVRSDCTTASPPR